jgi:hypothetical protein
MVLEWALLGVAAVVVIGTGLAAAEGPLAGATPFILGFLDSARVGVWEGGLTGGLGLSVTGVSLPACAPCPLVGGALGPLVGLGLAFLDV